MKSLFLFLFSFALVTAYGQYIDANIEKEFLKHSEVTYILKLKTKADISSSSYIKGKNKKGAFVFQQLIQHAKESQKELLSILDENNINYTSYFIINGIKVTSNKALFHRLSQRPEIEKIIWDIPTRMSNYMEERQEAILREPEPEWGILKINADKVWEMGYRGQGVVVAGQDTGYDWLVSPLQKKYRGYLSDSLGQHDYNWHDAIHEPSPLSADSINPCGFDVKIPCDDHNHGTHTMGTIVGSDSLNAIGVAPESKWIACRNMDRGNGSPSTYLECFEWFLAPTDLTGENPDPSKAPHVINNSWSCPEKEGCNPTNWSILEDAVNNLRAAGTVVVVSAGNDGSNCGTIINPASIFEGSFSVGATRSTDSIAGFSSRGLVTIDSSFRIKPNISAPGQNVRSVIRGGDFRNFSGTSMAGPHVAGLVSLIISANPSLAGEVERIEDIIEQSAVPLTTEQECGGLNMENIPNTTYGFGRIDALRAVQLAQQEPVEFAPVGAEWIYDFTSFESEDGTYKIKCIDTASINGKLCKVLVKEQATCDLLADTIYIHQDYNKVFHYGNETDSFYLVYDFNKIAEQMYRTDYFNWTGVVNPEDTLYVYNQVDSVKTIELGGQLFMAQYIHSTTNGASIVIPQLGDLKRMFQAELSLCDGALTTALRCYKDNNIEVKLTPDDNCEAVLGVNQVLSETLYVHPNPTHDLLYVSGLKAVERYQVHSLDGVQILKGTLAAGQSINVSSLQSGIYVISFDKIKRNIKFVKI